MQSAHTPCRCKHPCGGPHQGSGLWNDAAGNPERQSSWSRDWRSLRKLSARNLESERNTWSTVGLGFHAPLQQRVDPKFSFSLQHKLQYDWYANTGFYCRWWWTSGNGTEPYRVQIYQRPVGWHEWLPRHKHTSPDADSKACVLTSSTWKESKCEPHVKVTSSASTWQLKGSNWMQLEWRMRKKCQNEWALWFLENIHSPA